MKIVKYLTALIIFITIAAYPQSPVVSLPAIVAPPGQKIVIPITVTNFNNIGAVSFKILYNSAVVHFDSSSRRSEFISNASAGVIGIGRADVNPVIPSNGKLLDLYFTFSGDSTVFAFKTSECELASVDGNIISNVTYINGRVTADLPPFFTFTLPDINNSEGDTLVFDFNAEDPNDDALTFSLPAGNPAGAVINPSTGLFQWIVGYDQAGDHKVIVNVTDGINTTSDTSFVHVFNTNRAPNFTHTFPDTTVANNQLIVFDYDAVDPDGDAIRYFLMNDILGAAVDPITGVLTWRVDFSNVPFRLIMCATDGSVTIKDTAFISLADDEEPPYFIDRLPDQNNLKIGDTLFFQYTGSDPDGVANLSFGLINPPPGASIEPPSGLFRFIPQSAGVFKIIVFLTDDTHIVYDTSTVIVNNANQAPVFTKSLPDTSVYKTQQIIFDYDAFDPDGDMITYSIVSNIPGASIDSVTGLFTWTIPHDNIIYIVIIGASDGTTITKDYAYITVPQSNHPPHFINTMPDQLNRQVGDTILFNYSAGDVDDFASDLRFALLDPPPGALIDPISGHFQFIPQSTGTFKIIATVTDQKFVTYDTSLVTVVTTNHPPFFVNPLPDTTIYEGDTLKLNIVVSDPDGNENLRIGLVNPPPIAVLNLISRYIIIVPGYNQAGVYKIIISLTDQVVTVFDTCIVTVLNKNRPPVFTKVMLDQTVVSPDTNIFDYDAIDPDGDSVKYSLLHNIPGAVIDSVTGVFTYIVDYHTTPAIIIVGASDGELMTTDTARVYVDIIHRIPYFINTMPDQLNRVVGDTITYHYTGGDSDGVADLRFGLYNPPPGATIDSVSGQFRFITPSLGTFTIIVTLTDQIVTVFDTAMVDVVTRIKPESGLPSDYTLLQNYPNPFNPVTTIRFSLPKESFVTLTIYNLIGQNVATLVNEVLPAAYHEYNFIASNLTSGIYIYKLQAGEFTATRKMTLLK